MDRDQDVASNPGSAGICGSSNRENSSGDPIVNLLFCPISALLIAVQAGAGATQSCALHALSMTADVLSSTLVEERIFAIAMNPADSAGARLITGGSKGELVVWDTAPLRRLHTIPHEGNHGAIRALCITPDGQYILAGMGNGALLVFAAPALKQEQELVRIQRVFDGIV